MGVGVQHEAGTHTSVVESNFPKPAIVEDMVNSCLVTWKRMVTCTGSFRIHVIPPA
jgi:hypothetical protein